MGGFNVDMKVIALPPSENFKRLLQTPDKNEQQTDKSGKSGKRICFCTFF